MLQKTEPQGKGDDGSGVGGMGRHRQIGSCPGMDRLDPGLRTAIDDGQPECHRVSEVGVLQ